MASISIIIPAYNEVGSIVETVRQVDQAFRESGHTHEIIVVDDCSDDATADQARETVARVIRHPTNKGYGNALLTGVRNARHPWIAITDADGTYPVSELPDLFEDAVQRDLDMLVGARQGKYYYESFLKCIARFFFKRITEFVVGQSIPDVNSGMRIIRRDLIARCAPALSGGFSFTTSITIIAFQTGHHVAYRPIAYFARYGQSHIRYRRDALRALQIIVMTIVLFNPIKLYLLQALVVGTFSVGAMAAIAALPGFSLPLLTGTLGFIACNLIMALGFLAVRQQSNLADLQIPKRGYEPAEQREKDEHTDGTR